MLKQEAKKGLVPLQHVFYSPIITMFGLALQVLKILPALRTEPL